MIFHRGSDGGLSGYAFLPPLAASAGDVLLQRRLELAQRYLQQGPAGAVLEVLTPRWAAQSEAPGNREELALLERRADPVADLLGAYARLRARETAVHTGSGAPGPAPAGGRGPLPRFRELSDTHVIRAAWALLEGDGATAAAHCREALDRGLPLFHRGILLLSKQVVQLGVEHPGVQMLGLAAGRRAGGTALGLWNPGPRPPAPRELEEGIQS
ncbi:MAG TPA: hypothetical protein ENK13_01580 [Thermopetrobacter sp.]|nr:hypothetical protein [Thermopetrobacter sp.]